jgi:hypothetical protein
MPIDVYSEDNVVVGSRAIPPYGLEVSSIIAKSLVFVRRLNYGSKTR